MTSWETALKDVSNGLGCVYHLLREEHNDEYTAPPSVEKKLVSAGADSNGNTLDDVNRILKASQLLDNDRVWEEIMEKTPAVSTSADHPKTRIRIEVRTVVNTKTDPPTLTESIRIFNQGPGPLNIDPMAVIRKVRSTRPRDARGFPILPPGLTFGTSTPSPSQRINISPHPISEAPVPQEPRFPDQPQANDPLPFHTNAYDSPPPSPGHEMEDHADHMRHDPNGAIPTLAELGLSEDDGVQGNNNSDEDKNTFCHIKLCNSFHHLLKTTPENVQDKQNILKELLHHSDVILRKAIENCPSAITEELVELAASIVLINNSLQRSTNYQAFQSNSGIALSLVMRVKTAIEKHII
ncbi:hypothetical protein L5515_016497 [Caenorhabditis briggsae]|uniref:Uncharacterized protein n=1 Tax=Caenorhabditis briggsae TaxID=6238 RepID=A0AAE9FAS5_CAEBR|nr:hypothetical protein L3Y34_010608 [Caenorhabditis briggsae]UMM39429.1 hypothetical protein L5515_016497 [Caenorhabditis briggsae]